MRLRTGNLHEVPAGGRQLLFHLPTAALFEADPLVGCLLDLLRTGDEVDEAEVRHNLSRCFSPADIGAAIAELVRLELVDAGPRPLPAPAPPSLQPALTTLVLAMTNGCNLACGYCYKEDLTRPGRARRMSEARAREAVDLLIRESGAARRVTITFFGGEPLLELDLIRSTVAYADPAGRAAGKTMDYSLTTNATLLDDAAIDFLDAHRFGITVSIDGPADIHDRYRRTAGGQGSYAAAAAVHRLLERPRTRPVGARVTLAAGATDVVGIHAHLHNELGFTEVGFAPVTAAASAGFCLDEAELRLVFDGFRVLGRTWRDAALAGRDIGFGNIAGLAAVLHQGARRQLPCGAGTQLLAADADGGLHLCHRFVGSDVATLGTTAGGIDRAAVEGFVARARDRVATFCESCLARPVCAGGCYHESQVRHGDPFRLTDHYCALMRAWVSFGIGVYADVMAKNPGFFATHAQPRRAAT